MTLQAVRGMARLLLIVLLGSPQVLAQDSTSAVEYFPGRKIFPLFTADARAHQFSLSAITKNSEWIGVVGASIPMVQVNVDDLSFQAGVAASVFNRLIKTPGHLTVYTVDYKVDIPFDLRISKLSLRAALGHISCHFADDAIEMFGEQSIQHVNDYITLGAAYDIPAILGYVYAGANYSYGTQPIPGLPWLIQFGGDFANIAIHEEVSLYGAIDIKLKEEVGWGTTQSYQVGLKLFPQLHRMLRIAYTYRTGYDERGQFYLRKDELHLISAFIDI